MSLLTKTRRIFVRERMMIAGFLVILGFFTIEFWDELSIYKSSSRFVGTTRSRVTNGCIYDALNKTLANKKTSRQNILLLSSMGRSGSSFLGGLLDSLQGVFYYFEPFYNFGQWGIHSQELAVRSLKELYLCNYTGMVFKAIKSRGYKSVKHPYFSNCGSRDSCFDPIHLSKVCSKQPILLVKTIRTRVSWLPPLLKDPDLDLRVVHIVRDPRAAIISNWRAGWNNNPKNLCDALLEDLEYGLYLRKTMPNRYLPVRYEDICANPLKMAKIIFRFLGYSELPSSAVRFLEKSTSQNNEPKNAYSLQRNSTEQQQKWRGSILNQHLLRIESSCADSIRHLGFNLFENIGTTRNLSFPLFNESSENQLFHYRDC